MNDSVTTSQLDLRIFRDWMNNYLTVETMAEHYQLTESEMLGHIARGRTRHDHIAAQWKEINP